MKIKGLMFTLMVFTAFLFTILACDIETVDVGDEPGDDDDNSAGNDDDAASDDDDNDENPCDGKPDGTRVPAPDGCNSCFCQDGQLGGCTEMWCEDDDDISDECEPGECGPAPDMECRNGSVTCRRNEADDCVWNIYCPPACNSDLDCQGGFICQDGICAPISNECTPEECTPAPDMPNWQCPDGSIGGPVCIRFEGGGCGWEVRECPPVKECTLEECGPAPGMPNWECPDGSIGGPVCQRLADGNCGWEIRECLPYANPCEGKKDGTQVPAPDGCNTCVCQGGEVGACTEMACADCIVAEDCYKKYGVPPINCPNAFWICTIENVCVAECEDTPPPQCNSDFDCPAGYLCEKLDPTFPGKCVPKAAECYKDTDCGPALCYAVDCAPGYDCIPRCIGDECIATCEPNGTECSIPKEESCNGIDDDCNGVVDDIVGCNACYAHKGECIPVYPGSECSKGYSPSNDPNIVCGGLGATCCLPNKSCQSDRECPAYWRCDKLDPTFPGECRQIYCIEDTDCPVGSYCYLEFPDWTPGVCAGK